MHMTMHDAADQERKAAKKEKRTSKNEKSTRQTRVKVQLSHKEEVSERERKRRSRSTVQCVLSILDWVLLVCVRKRTSMRVPLSEYVYIYIYSE